MNDWTRRPGETEPWAVVALVFAVIFLVGSAAVPVAVAEVVTFSEDRLVEPELLGILLGVIFSVAFIFGTAEVAKRNVRRHQDLVGFGYAHAAEILLIFGVLGMVVSTALSWNEWQRARDEGLVSANSQEPDPVFGADSGGGTSANDVRLCQSFRVLWSDMDGEIPWDIQLADMLAADDAELRAEAYEAYEYILNPNDDFEGFEAELADIDAVCTELGVRDAAG